MKLRNLVILAVLVLTFVSGVSHAKKMQKFALWRKDNAMNCNVFLWYTSSWSTTSSTSSDSCDYLVPLVKNKNEEIKNFVDVNRDRLMEEMAQGQGPVLSDYATLMGCPVTAVPTFNRAAQESFTNVFEGAKDSSDILRNTQKSLGNVKELREKCTVHLS